MAKRKQKPADFTFETLSEKESEKRLKRRARRRSKYSVIGDQLDELRSGDVLAFEASKNEVQGIRNYVRRNYEDEYKVSSRRVQGETYEVHISESEDD